MTVSTAQGRYYLLNTPVASPGQCGICGYSGSDRSYLDPRLDFEFYGTLIFCSECMASMAEVMGFIEPAKARSLETRVEEAERELVTLRAAVVAIEEFKRAVGIAMVPAVGTNSAGPNIIDVVVPRIEGEQELPFDTGLAERPDDREVTEQTASEGRDDVRGSDASREFGIDFL